MVKLPEQFIENMKKQLPENEWEAFFAIYGKAPFKGVRLNPLKGGRDALKPLLPFLGEPVAWEENGYYTAEERWGNPLIMRLACSTRRSRRQCAPHLFWTYKKGKGCWIFAPHLAGKAHSLLVK